MLLPSEREVKVKVLVFCNCSELRNHRISKRGSCGLCGPVTLHLSCIFGSSGLQSGEAGGCSVYQYTQFSEKWMDKSEEFQQMFAIMYISIAL